MKEIDTETQKVQNEGEKAHYLTKNEDWNWAKRKLLQKVSNLDSIKTLKEKENINQEIKVRKIVIDIILEWLDEIEGIAQQHGEQSPNKLKLNEVQSEDYIKQLE